MLALRLELERIRASPLARNAGWMVLGQGSGFLLQAAYFILIARLLGAYEYGLFAGAFALTGIVGEYSSMGSGTLFLRHVTADPNQFSRYWGNILLATCLFGTFIVTAIFLVSPHLLGPGSQSIALLAAIANCFCNQLTASAGKVFQTYEQLRITASLNLATNFARALAAGALLIAIHHGTAFQWALVSVIVSALIAIAAIIMVTAKYGRPKFSLTHSRKSLPEGFGFAFAVSTSSTYNDIDKTMLSHYGMHAAN